MHQHDCQLIFCSIRSSKLNLTEEGKICIKEISPIQKILKIWGFQNHGDGDSFYSQVLKGQCHEKSFQTETVGV